MVIGQVPLAIFLAVLLGLGISYFQDLLPDFPGYASTLFANAMIIGQLLGNLLGGVASDVVGLASFIIGFLGLVFPVVPSVLMFWIGFLVYHFALNSETLSWMFWIIVFVLTVLVLFSDFIANSYFVKRQ